MELEGVSITSWNPAARLARVIMAIWVPEDQKKADGSFELPQSSLIRPAKFEAPTAHSSALQRHLSFARSWMQRPLSWNDDSYLMV
jgi:hypothetical protein